MKQTWIHFQNPFYNVGIRNFKKALKISTYTDGALMAKQADPFFGPIYTAYHPLHTALYTKYTAWQAQGDVQQGGTLTVDQLLKMLSPTKINAWDYAILGVYAKKTPNYVVLLPNGHKPFQTGGKLGRIAAVTQLKDNLTKLNEPKLATTLTDVTNFEAQLLAANTTQAGLIGTTKSYSADVEKVITDAMEGLFGILGQCIAHFKDDATQAEFLFDLETIRNHEQVVFTAGIKPGDHETLVTHTFADTDTISVEADGATDIGVYLAEKNGAAPAGFTVVTVKAGTSQEISIGQFANDTANRFLSVTNLSATAQGHVKVDIS